MKNIILAILCLSPIIGGFLYALIFHTESILFALGTTLIIVLSLGSGIYFLDLHFNHDTTIQEVGK